jgi:hypothetical protein
MQQAYSRLKQILHKRRWTLAELRKRLEKTGVRPGARALARLDDDATPLERLDLRLAGAICDVCEVPLSGLIVFHNADDGFRRLSATKQKRLDWLLDGNREGTLSRAEHNELHKLVRETEEMTLHNARYLVEQREKAERK